MDESSPSAGTIRSTSNAHKPPRKADKGTSQTTTNEGDPKFPNGVDRATDSIDHKLPEKQPEEPPKRRHEIKRASNRVSRAFGDLVEGICNYMAPANDGSAFMQEERRKCAIADMVESDPNPWHEYERLDSDSELDGHDLYYGPRRKTRRARIKAWLSRITTMYGESISPQGVGAIGTL